MGLTDYKVRLTEDAMVVRAESFAPLSLTSSESIAIKGGLTIHGAATCDSLRGASIGAPVILASAIIDVGASSRYAFISPIVGRIKSAHYILESVVVVPTLVLSFFNSDGVKAATELISDATAENTVDSVDFDWTDANDLLFCSVGIGSAFWVRVDTVQAGKYGFVCVEIQPLLSGGTYE